MNLRPATIDDAAFLVSLRTPGSSRTEVTLDDTKEWLLKEDPNRIIMIAEVENGREPRTPVGSVRSDFRDNAAELSYYITPAFQGKGFGKLMLTEFLLRYHKFHAWRAIIKKGNTMSEKLAQSMHMKPISEDAAGFVTWYDEAADPAMI